MKYGLQKNLLLTFILAFLTPLSIADTSTSLVTNSVNFDFNSSTLNKPAQDKLTDIANIIQKESGVTRINLDGHSDKMGSTTYNKNLSQKRADNVKEHLINQKVDPSLIVAIGQGSQNSIVSDSCFNKLGADNYLKIQELKTELENKKFHSIPLSKETATLKYELQAKLTVEEKTLIKLQECTAPDRRVTIKVTTSTPPFITNAASKVTVSEVATSVINDSGTYINLNTGYGTQQFMPNGSFAGTFNAGYNFNRNFALEGGYALLASQQYGVSVAQNIFDIAAKGTIHLSDIFSIYGRLGGGFSNFTFNGTQNNGPAWFARSTFAAQNNAVGMGSVGGSFSLNKHFDLRIEDTLYIPVGGNGGQNTIGNTNLILGGAQYNF